MTLEVATIGAVAGDTTLIRADGDGYVHVLMQPSAGWKIFPVLKWFCLLHKSYQETFELKEELHLPPPPLNMTSICHKGRIQQRKDCYRC